MTYEDVIIRLAAIAATPPVGPWLSVREQAVVATLTRPERRSTWLAGRWLAKSVVAELEPYPVSDVEILAAPDGAPELWLSGRPYTCSLSISHRAGWVGVALAPEFGIFVGFDLERIEPRSAAFVRDYLTDAEQAWVMSHGDPALAANLVWSAKEAALKALRSGLRRDTLSVAVTISGDSLSVRDVTTDHILHGHWQRATADMLWTVVASRHGHDRDGEVSGDTRKAGD